MTTRAVILFDKNGRLAELKARADAAHPLAYDLSDAPLDQGLAGASGDVVPDERGMLRCRR